MSSAEERGADPAAPDRTAQRSAARRVAEAVAERERGRRRLTGATVTVSAVLVAAPRPAAADRIKNSQWWLVAREDHRRHSVGRPSVMISQSHRAALGRVE